MTAHDRQALEAAGPKPRRVLNLDLEQDLPDLVADSRYGSAMVIGWRSGVPIGAVDIVLGDTPDLAREQLAPLVATPAPDLAAGAGAGTSLPGISIVICTMVERREDLVLLLDSLANQRYQGAFEIIIADNRTTEPAVDVLPALLEAYPSVRVVHQRKAGISAARNAGVAAARYEVVAFTDDDVRVDEHWLDVIGERFSRPDRIDVMTGMILPAELETPAQFWFERYYGGFSGERLFAPAVLRGAAGLPRVLRGSRIVATDVHGTEISRFSVYGIGAYGAGANMAYRRSSLIASGGFDNALGTGTPARGGEDLATLIQLLWNGATLAFEPGAVVHHRHRQTLAELEKQLHGNGLGFTAQLTSLIAADRRHLLGLGWQVPLASATMLKQTVSRVVKKSRGTEETLEETIDDAPFEHASILDSGYPHTLVYDELRGFPKGPLAYVKSRRWWKATQAHKAEPDLVSAGLE